MYRIKEQYYFRYPACARVQFGPPLISSGKESIWLTTYYVAKEGRIVTLIIKEVIVVDKRENTEIWDADYGSMQLKFIIECNQVCVNVLARDRSVSLSLVGQ